jgi:hypothetical protein
VTLLSGGEGCTRFRNDGDTRFVVGEKGKMANLKEKTEM